MDNFDRQTDNLFIFDYYRMTGEKYKPSLRSFIKILLSHNLQFMFWYRRFQKYHGLMARGILYKFSRKYGLEISTKVQIGKGMYLGHPYNITVGDGVVLGENVFVGINATVVGKIIVGNDVLIASNSYVNTNVPDHAVVIGNPAVIHPKENATETYVCYCI